MAFMAREERLSALLQLGKGVFPRPTMAKLQESGPWLKGQRSHPAPGNLFPLTLNRRLMRAGTKEVSM